MTVEFVRFGVAFGIVNKLGVPVTQKQFQLAAFGRTTPAEFLSSFLIYLLRITDVFLNRRHVSRKPMVPVCYLLWYPVRGVELFLSLSLCVSNFIMHPDNCTL